MSLKNEERKSLFVYLDENNVPLETIKLIKDFFKERREAAPVYKYPNGLDNEEIFPCGAHQGRKPMDINIPLKYVRWWLSQKKMNQNFPLFTNTLRKEYEKLMKKSEETKDVIPQLASTLKTFIEEDNEAKPEKSESSDELPKEPPKLQRKKAMVAKRDPKKLKL